LNPAPLSPREILSLYDADIRSDPPPDDGIRFERIGGVVRGTGHYNLIFFADLTEASADAAISEQVAYFNNPRAELQWKVFGHDHPSDIGRRLASAGFELDPPETFMVLALANYAISHTMPGGVEIRRVSDTAGLRDFVAVGENAFGRNESWRFDAYGPRLADPTLGIFVAYAEGRPVCAGRLELPKARIFCGIWGGGTVPAFRSRGIYTGLVHARAKEAARLGYRYLTVDARDTSRLILERLGFVPLTSIRDYVLNRSKEAAITGAVGPDSPPP
jgi:GNAT superfamily N-acetyltransferase